MNIFDIHVFSMFVSRGVIIFFMSSGRSGREKS